MTTVIFIDKDGTLIEDLPYNVDPRRIRLAPGAGEALAIWAERGWPMAIVTNQSGVARGYFTLEELDAVADHLEAVITDAGGLWGGFYACPHLPEGINEYAIDCDCRKPAPGMIRDAAAKLGASPEESWFIGDTWMDMAAGRAVGCRTILVGREWRDGASYPPEAQPDYAVPDLAEAARITVADALDDKDRAETVDEDHDVEELVS
jgi:D-glycero-D-manno-heptose 1,7-bisphosphate phosphatase